jgi:hypothetical protein
MPAALPLVRGPWCQGWETIARGASYQGLSLARHIPLPSFLSTTGVITIAAAGTLTLATAIAAATATIPSSVAPASASDAFLTQVGQQQAAAQTAHTPAAGGAKQAIPFDQMRAVLDERRRQQQLAAAKAAAAKAAALKAAAVAAAQSAQQAQPPQQAQSAQQAQPPQQEAVTTPSGSPQQIAEQMLSQFGWPASQFACLEPLWEQESGWDVTAENPSSGAYGIPQALPGSRMSSAGADWETDAATQISWGLTYIQGRYGSPCGAWAHEEADGWY